MDGELRLIGVGASPYTRKLRAALRFRRIPYRFVIFGSTEQKSLPERPLPLMPCLVFPGPDGEPSDPMSDTTPIFDRLEADFPERPLRPLDPALAFIDALIEDYGDEWLSKCMFHYRWAYAADTKKASAYMPYAQSMTMPVSVGQQFEKMVAERQISRIGVVGSNPTTAPVIEASWERFLHIFDAHLQNQPFLLGRRPGAGDFACFGQMTMLVITDPTPMQIALEISPRAYAWTESLEDLSGMEVSESDWLDLGQPPDTLRALLGEIGRVYAPFLLGNAAAIERGDESVECEVDGQPWVQVPFVYQAKCLRWLREHYGALPEKARESVDGVLAGTGCESLFV
ncbi:MAG: glutathione S-transferase family protein [bacterium]|nr:glutathione S-transferase family protein [bacterium]